MMDELNNRWYHLAGINPEPWEAPNVATGRRGGKVVPMVYKSEPLRAFQEAVREEFATQNPATELIDGQPIALEFFLWRQLPTYEIGDSQKSRRHQADATNMQKALEDALQGILFKNDRDVQDIRTRIMAQSEDTEPFILIKVSTKFDDAEGSMVSMYRIQESRKAHPSNGGVVKQWAVEEVF